MLERIQDITKVMINGIFTPTCSVVSTVPLQRYYKEVVLWSTLSHPNILKLLAVEGGKKYTSSPLCRSGWIGLSWITSSAIMPTGWS